MIKLGVDDKFFIEDDNDLILVDEIDLDLNMVKNNFIVLEGTRFFVDYENNNIDKANSRVVVTMSFNIESVNEVD